MAFRTTGYDILILRGRAEKPTYLQITDEEVLFLDASPLWGKNTTETQEALGMGKNDGALVIGPAGENKVLYANIMSGHRFLGRGGLGAVMGSKNLKAIVARGGIYKILPANEAKFKAIKDLGTRQINANTFTAKMYRNYGTAANVNMSNKGGILPVFNFRGGKHEQAVAISGEVMQQRFTTKPSTCRPCTILCGHRGTYPDGSTHQIPEYETAALFGPNLGIFDPEIITEWNDVCGMMGMDTMSTAGTLAWVMEAGEKGIRQTNLKFGHPEGVTETLKMIAAREEEGDEIANGSRWLSRKYGGKEFAIQVKGMEIAAYDPRGAYGQGLAYAVANRGGCHLSATIFPLEVYFGFLNPLSPNSKVDFVIFMENLYAAVNSITTCLFTNFAYVLEAPLVKFTPKPLLGLAMQLLPGVAVKLMDLHVFSVLYESISGIRLSQTEMMKTGERIHILERWLNEREGVTKDDDILPDRFLNEGRDCDPGKNTVPLYKMRSSYYRRRGFDKNGKVTLVALKKAGISDLLYIKHNCLPEQKKTLPPTKKIKTNLVTIVMSVLGRGFQKASRLDENIRSEVAAWPEKLIVKFKVNPDGPALTLQKNRQGSLDLINYDVEDNLVGVEISFHNIESAFLLFTAQIGATQANAEHRMSVRGDIGLTMSFIRCLNIVQAYLFPNIVARHVMRRVPEIPPAKLAINRLRIYLAGILFGR